MSFYNKLVKMLLKHKLIYATMVIIQWLIIIANNDYLLIVSTVVMVPYTLLIGFYELECFLNTRKFINRYCILKIEHVSSTNVSTEISVLKCFYNQIDKFKTTFPLHVGFKHYNGLCILVSYEHRTYFPKIVFEMFKQDVLIYPLEYVHTDKYGKLITTGKYVEIK